MSYTKSFNKTITVRYSGYVSYPASKSGGTVSYSGTATENVQVNIRVDTDDFDSEVNDCKSKVNLLTGAVVATEAAQVASVSQSSKKIASTIVSGFFKTVRSDISQQITELKNVIDSNLSHLQSLAKRIQVVQETMGTDYRRLCERYGSIFNDLNRELRKRIFMLDKPAFDTRDAADDKLFKTISSDMVGTSTVGDKETGHLRAMLSATGMKSLAKEAIHRVNDFLRVSYSTAAKLDKSSQPAAESATLYTQALYIETVSEGNAINRQVYAPHAFVGKERESALLQHAQAAKYGKMSDADQQRILYYYNQYINTGLDKNDSHTQRVKQQMRRMINLDKIN